MSDVEIKEALVASVAVDDDHQICLIEWKRTASDGITQSSRSTIERCWQIGLFDSDGNAIATLARTEVGQPVTTTGAWAMFLAMIPPVTVERARNGVFFDLGAGPERQKA